MVVDKIDLVTRSDFLALTCFDFTIHSNQAISDCLFRITAAVAQTFEFEYLVKFDELCFEFRNNVVARIVYSNALRA